MPWLHHFQPGKCECSVCGWWTAVFGSSLAIECLLLLPQLTSFKKAKAAPNLQQGKSESGCMVDCCLCSFSSLPIGSQWLCLPQSTSAEKTKALALLQAVFNNGTICSPAFYHLKASHKLLQSTNTVSCDTTSDQVHADHPRATDS